MGQRLCTFSDLRPDLVGTTHTITIDDAVTILIDLTDDEFDMLCQKLQPYVQVGRYSDGKTPPIRGLRKRSGGQPGRRPDITKEQRDAVRRFRRSRGHAVSNGRISGADIAEWEEAGCPEVVLDDEGGPDDVSGRDGAA